MTRGRLMLASALTLGIAAGYGALQASLYEALTPPLLAPMEPAAGVGSLSAKACATCHEDIAAEWEGTGHARATTDPLYVADLAAQSAPYFCDHCHAPLVEQRATTTTGLWSAWPDLVPRAEDNPRVTQGLRHEGVTCVACPQRDGAMLGAFATTIAPHPVTVNADFGSEATCRPCHTLDLQAVGDLQRPLMDTFGEWEAYRAAGGDRTCVDCHMPTLADRPAARGGAERPAHSHALRGPFDLAFVKEGVGVEGVALQATPEGGVAGRLALINRSGHRLPTAEPHRKLTVALELLGAEGEVLASAAHHVQRVVDLHSLAEPSGADTTLAPRERRPISLDISPAPAARSARLVVRFWLWDPDDPIAQSAGLDAAALVHTLHSHSLTLTSEP